MLLGVKMLKNAVNVNSFEYANEILFTAGDTVNVQFQLMDMQKNTCSQCEPGLRYMPQVGAILTVTFQNVNDAVTFSKVCVQPFSQDPSIWQFQILPADGLSGSYSFSLSLNEGGLITNARSMNSVMVRPLHGVSV